jgi:hypothetical protein
MTQIILNDEQARVFVTAGESVELRDESGRLLGLASRGPTEEELAEARRRLASDGPWFTTQQVLDHLRSLEQQ